GFNVTENPHMQADPAAFQIAGAKAIVDWVLVELRMPYTPGVVLSSRVGLLQRDGTVVNTDGVNPFSMHVTPGDYMVALRHRNHLGVMTNFPIPVNAQTQMLD